MSTTQETFMPVKPSGTRFPKWVYEANYRIVDQSNIREALTEVVKADVVAWDTEFKATHQGQIVSAFTFSTRPNTGWMLPVKMRHIDNLPLDIVEKFVYAFSKKRNVCQAARAEMRSVMHTWPDKWQSMLNITDDIQVSFYLLDPNEAKDFKESKPGKRGSAQPIGYSLTAMALKYLRLEIPDLKDFWKNGGSFDYLDAETARLYSCSDADVTLRLFLKGVDASMTESVIYKLEMQLLSALLAMEMRGVLFDKDLLAEVAADAGSYVAQLKEQAYEQLRMDRSINIDSTDKLANHIYNVLGWPGYGKKGKKGLWSVDKNALSRFTGSADKRIALPAQALVEYRKWRTLHNNFLTRLGDYQNPHTGAIHASFLSTVVPTGRLACASPNMQQIPQRNDKAPLRRAFIPRKGRFFFEADYSQIELRVYAGETQEPYFFECFEKDIDLHLRTASVIFREKITDKEDPRRQMGKTMNFGPIYGMKPEGLAMRTDYDLAEAERILDDFWAAIPLATRWTQDVYNKARQKGGVHTHFGRWRPLPWINSRVPYEREFGERSAVNTIVQGTAADIMKFGLVRLHKRLTKPDCPFDARAVLTIHDSVMLEAAEDTDPLAFLEFVRESLCFPIEGYPPLDIDAKVGPNWHDMEPLKPDTKVEVSSQSIAKSVAVPDLNPEQKGKFLQIVKAVRHDQGELDVMFNTASGSIGPVPMEGSGYQQILTFLVEQARLNKLAAEKVAASADPLDHNPGNMLVSFA